MTRTARLYSTIGRPRSLTDAQVERIMEWQRNLKTKEQLAAEMGVPKSTVEHCLRLRGQFKRPPPDKCNPPVDAETGHR